jgi:hypothetical protein
MISDGAFSDLITKALFFDAAKFAWDLQKTALGYFEAVDQLTGSSLKKEFLEAYDENGDGTVDYVDYEELGKKGAMGPMMYLAGRTVAEMGTERYGFLRGAFTSRAMMLKLRDPSWNRNGHDLLRESELGATCIGAYMISQLEIEAPDPFIPDLTWGKGKWPSFQLAQHMLTGMALYGPQYPNKIAFPSLYFMALHYADLTQNGGQYFGEVRSEPDQEVIDTYVAGSSKDEEKALDFTFYVPPGYGNLQGEKIPNVQETSDPAKILTASFNNSQEIWPNNLELW